MPADRLSFVHAVADEQCPVEAVRKLDGRFRVNLVPGGHRLDHPVARETVWSCLHRLRQTLAV